MKDYLILLPKSAFTDLFKYGYLYTDTIRWIQFDGDIDNLYNNAELREKVFERTNAFDYTFTYLIVHFKSESTLDGRINIESVQNLFPLDNDGKREIELSFDPRIRINEPIWSAATQDLQIRFLYEDVKKGALNIWKILKIERSITEVQDIISQENLKEIVREVLSDDRPKGELSFWIYLMRYERHGFFPKTTKGYFYDLINVYINTTQHKEFPAEAIESTGIYNFLSELRNDLHLEELLNALSEEQIGRSFLDKVCDIADLKTPNASGAIVAILFLVLRDKIAEDFSLNAVSEKIISYSVSTYPHEAYYALFLLGLYLGNTHTFECLYDNLPLPIFKSVLTENVVDQIEPGKVDTSNMAFPLPSSKGISAEQTSLPKEEQREFDVKDNKKNHVKDPNQSLLAESSANNEHLHFPIYMRKKEDVDAGIISGRGYKIAKNTTQYNKHLQNGYVPVKK